MYSHSPSDREVDFDYELVSPPSFVSMDKTGEQHTVKVATSSHGHTGVYTVEVKVTEKLSGLTDSQKFTLTVSCVKTVSAKDTVSQSIYYISDDAKEVDLDGYDVTPSQCPNQIEYSVTQSDGSALPDSIQISSDGT